MKRALNHLLSLAAGILLPAAAFAQGSLTGGLESTLLYDDDPASAWHGFHANNYLKLDYTLGGFRAGIQAEWYPDPLPGFDLSLKGAGVPVKYVSYQGRSWSITAGDFYEQFGSGIILRSWEDRDLGLNNSLGGLRMQVSPLEGIQFKAIAAIPRKGLWYASGAVLGGDLILEPFSLLGVSSAHSISVEGSVTDRWEFRPEEDLSLLLGADVPLHTVLYSARLGWAWKGLSAKAEYVGKGTDVTALHQASGSDLYALKGGRAVTTEVNFARGGFSGTLTWRYLDNMALRAWRTVGNISPSNTLNYLPALCQQQTYMLASLNPYETFAEGESGFRGDLYYRFRRGSALGGKYGMKVHVGGSWIDGLAKALPLRESNHLAYRDLNIDLEKTWSRQWKTILFVSIQENSPTHGNRKATNAQNVFVLENLWKFSKKGSVRTELQYLYSQELTRDWMAGLVEVGLAPHWSFSVSDMYNHGDTHQHYWNVSAAFAHQSFRAMLGYGRNREGMVCSGGVCRWQPEYKGFNLSIQWSF